jgi:HK97 family phage prohead protease
MKDYIKNISDKAERRFFASSPEVRAEGESKKVQGLGIVYNSLSENFWPGYEGGLYEVIEPGAARGLLDDEDIMILFNHDPSLVLARNKNTATLEDTDGGVVYRYDSPNTTVASDLLENLKLRNVRKSSFAFMPKEVKNERMVQWGDMGKINIRRIVKFERLFDMSPVTYPAYNNTEVVARAFKSVTEEEMKASEEAIRLRKRKQMEYEIFKIKNS